MTQTPEKKPKGRRAIAGPETQRFAAPPGGKQKHQKGMTLMEVLVALSISTVVVAGIIFATQNTVRNQSAASDMMLAETSLKNTKSIIDQSLKAGTFVTVKKATGKGFTLSFRNGDPFEVTNQTKTGNSLSLTLKTGGRSLPDNADILLASPTGSAVLIQNAVLANNGDTATVDASCQNTPAATNGMTAHLLTDVHLAMGSELGSDFETQSLYTKVGNQDWAEIAKNMTDFGVNFVYEALDGSQISNPQELLSDPQPNYTYASKNYEIATLNINTGKNGQANPELSRTYASTIPLNRGALRNITRIKTCGEESQSTPGKGDLRVIIQGLPSSGVNADVTVTGPAGFNQQPTASKEYFNTDPGEYTAMAKEVTQGTVSFRPVETTAQKTMVSPWAPGTLTLNYARVQGSLDVTINGLPTEVTPLLTWGGPENITAREWKNGGPQHLTIQAGNYNFTPNGIPYGNRYFTVKSFSCTSPAGTCSQASVPVHSYKTTQVTVTFEERLVPVPMSYSSNVDPDTTVTIKGTRSNRSQIIPRGRTRTIQLEGDTYSLDGVTVHNGKNNSSGRYTINVDARAMGFTGATNPVPFEYQYVPPPEPRSGPGFQYIVSSSGSSSCSPPVEVDGKMETNCPPIDSGASFKSFDAYPPSCGGFGVTARWYDTTSEGRWNGSIWDTWVTKINYYSGICAYGDSGLYKVATELDAFGDPKNYICGNGPFTTPPPQSTEKVIWHNPPVSVSSCRP